VRALHRDDVRRLLDHADRARIPPGIAADLADLFFGEVETAATKTDAFLGLFEGSGQGKDLLRREAKQVKGQALGRLLADPREPGELVDESLYG
jgi:hypothetical protein